MYLFDIGNMVGSVRMSKSEELVKKTRKLTGAANTIQKELLQSSSDRSLLTSSEQETLRNAIAILRRSKELYEHNKEKEARAERQRERQKKQIETRNKTIATKAVKRLGIKSVAALLFFDERPYLASSFQKLTPRKTVPCYFSDLLRQSQYDHDALVRLTTELREEARRNLVEIILPRDYREYTGGWEGDEYDPHFHSPKELDVDIAINLMETTLLFDFSEYVNAFIKEVERLTTLSNDVTENLLEISRSPKK